MSLARVADTAFQPREDDHVMCLAMVDVTTSVEVHFAIRIGRGSTGSLGNAMIGVADLDDATVLDLLAELCNNLLGQAKTSLRSAEFEFSLATPDPSKPPVIPRGILAQRQLVLGWGEGSMMVTMALRLIPPTVVRARDLVENMVVVEDIKTPQGALLVPAGTRLTAVVAARVTRYLEDREVRVAMVGS
jgi:hypothetical protein